MRSGCGRNLRTKLFHFMITWTCIELGESSWINRKFLIILEGRYDNINSNGGIVRA